MLRRMVRRIFMGAGVLAVGAGVVAVLTYRGVGGVDSWVIRAVVAIGETYIVPDIRFERARFEAPGTVRFEGLALVAPDGTRVVDVGTLVVTLGEVPQRGRPLVIQSVELADGAVHLIRDETAPPGLTAFKGLVPFVRAQAVRQPETVSEDVRLSRVLRLNKIRLSNMGLEYAPGGGQPPMRLDGLELDMKIEPREVGGRVVHALDLDVDRGALFGLRIKGGFSLDDLTGDFETIEMHADVGPATYATLPPPLQAWLTAHDATGRIRLEAGGFVSVNDWPAADFRGALEVSRFNIAFGEYRLPIDSGTVEFRVGQGLVTVEPVAFRVLEGLVEAKAAVDLRATGMPASAEWDVREVSLQEALRAGVQEGEVPRLAGRVRSSGSATAALTDVAGTLSGYGEGNVREGRLVIFPLVRELNQVILGGGMLGGGKGLDDRFEAFFDIEGDRLVVTKMELHTPAMVARGDGRVYYDGRLDLALNAGPLEKLQSKLGEFGKILGQVTDRLVTYRVRGVMGAPKVTVETMGF